MQKPSTLSFPESQRGTPGAAAGPRRNDLRGGLNEPTYGEIAERAYALYERHGRQEGRHLEDWLQAEEELRRHGR